MGTEQSLKERVNPAPKPDVAANRRRLLRGAVIGIAVIAGLVSWLATREDGDGASEPAPAEVSPTRIVSEAEMREAAATLNQPIYWAGPVEGKELELKELSDGGVQVLYLPEGGEANRSSNTLTIGSYPLPDPAAALETVAERPGAVVRHADDGRMVVTSEGSPRNVYFASRDNSVQVEVYDQSPARAMRLALSARLQPVR